MKESKITTVYIRIVTIILLTIMLSILGKFIARNVLFERLHICKPFMTIFLFDDKEFMNSLYGDNETLQAADTDTPSIKTAIDWATEYPFYEDDLINKDYGKTQAYYTKLLNSSLYRTTHAYTLMFNNITERIDEYANAQLMFHSKLVTTASFFEGIVCGDFLPSVVQNVIFMKNGYLTYTQERLGSDDINEIAESVLSFKQFLEKLDIPLLYVDTGSKVCPENKQLSSGAVEYTNENANALLDALSLRQVDTLNLRDELLQSGLDWYDAYYINDHHWKTTTGLWCANTLACTLNEKYNFSFDETLFHKEQYNITTYENYFLGSQGRRVTLARANLEAFDLILPKYDTNFTVEIPSENLQKSGTYEDSMFDMEAFADIARYSQDDHLVKKDAYGCYTMQNYALTHAVNNLPTNNDGKRILFVRDSFMNPVLPLISGDITFVDAISLSSFNGSLMRYVEETKPDIVVIIYCAGNISPINWDTHTSAFDFR